MPDKTIRNVLQGLQFDGALMQQTWQAAERKLEGQVKKNSNEEQAKKIK